jgi:methylglutaconyl-CoA hydratase
VASLDATICLPETSLGIFPGAGGCVLLRNVVGPSVAKDLIYTARRIQGQEAKGTQHS